MEQKQRTQRKGLIIRMVVVSLAILLMGSFWLSNREASQPVSLVVTPMNPSEGSPVTATFRLNNPLPQPLAAEYEFYADGELLIAGDTIIAEGTGEAVQYVYKNPLQIGEQINFLLKAHSELGDYEKVVSLPAYAPQVMSSFVSFAAASTTMMSSMSTMVYYNDVVGGSTSVNVGLMVTLVLIALLVFAELTLPVIMRNKSSTGVIGRLRVQFSVVHWILFIIFIGLVYTNIVMILST
ncbi:hypothetical protein ACFLTS_03720 [Chloroflexota bacterium]